MDFREMWALLCITVLGLPGPGHAVTAQPAPGLSAKAAMHLQEKNALFFFFFFVFNLLKLFYLL